jgi:DNA-binding Lrp family transcriptional regulator
VEKLTERERAIIGLVELDPLTPARSIARQLRLRESAVQHTLRSLKSRGVIELRPFIDVSTLGQSDIGIFFSLGLTQKRAYTKFMQRLIASPSVAFVHSMAGDFHFLVALHCKDLREVRDFQCSLSEWSGGSVIMKSVVPRVKYIQYRKKYLTQVRPKEPSLVALVENKQPDISPEELQLLRFLSKSNSNSIRDAARQLGIPHSTVDYRYHQLIKKRVIKGWLYAVNYSYLPVQCYKLLVSCKQLTPTLHTRLSQFTLEHPSVTYLLETLGAWDFEIGVECESTSDVMGIIASLYECFPDQISIVRSLTELDVYKFNMFPN